MYFNIPSVTSWFLYTRCGDISCYCQNKGFNAPIPVIYIHIYIYIYTTIILGLIRRWFGISPISIPLLFDNYFINARIKGLTYHTDFIYIVMQSLSLT